MYAIRRTKYKALLKEKSAAHIYNEVMRMAKAAQGVLIPGAESKTAPFPYDISMEIWDRHFTNSRIEFEGIHITSKREAQRSSVTSSHSLRRKYRR